ASSLGRADVPFVAERVEGSVELGRPAVALGVGARGNRRAVAGLEVLAVVACAFECRDLEDVALQGVPVDTATEQAAQVLLVAPERRRLGAGRGRGRERPHGLEQ